MKRLLVLPAVVAGLANFVAAPLIMEGSLVAALGAVIATVTLTLTVVAWIDRRIDHKIRNYANINRFQFMTLLREISNLRELSGHPPLSMQELLKATGTDRE